MHDLKAKKTFKISKDFIDQAHLFKTSIAPHISYNLMRFYEN